jgi:hypothetical protein
MTKTLNHDEELIEIVFGWQNIEAKEGAFQIIDFQLIEGEGNNSAGTFLEILEQLVNLRQRAESSYLNQRILAYETFLRARMGECVPLEPYIGRTLGFQPAHFDSEVLDRILCQTEVALDEIGLAFNRQLKTSLTEIDTKVEANAFPEFLKEAFSTEKRLLERRLAISLDFDIEIEYCSVDEYWSYWVDGGRDGFRLRINMQGRKQPFSWAEGLQFLSHEILAHCGQMSQWMQQIESQKLPRSSGLTFVAGPEQFCFEGLAQTLPLWLYGKDINPILKGRVLVDLYTSLVKNNAHIMINSGFPVEACIDYMISHLPYTHQDGASRDLRSRSTNPLFRAYQLVYPASFLAFFEKELEIGTCSRADDFLKACYTRFMSASEIAQYE